MNRDEIIDILTAVQVGDHRTIGRLDIDFWMAVAGNLTKDDAMQAVIDHRREQPGVWLEPGHVVAGVRAIRRDRYERQSEQERAQREAICDSKVDGWVAELAAAKSIPADDEPVRFIRPSSDPTTSPLLKVACPYCRAPVGQRCTNNATKKQLRAAAHPARIVAAAAGHEHHTTLTICPACHTRPLVTEEDAARGMCDHCAPHVAPPKTKAPTRNNA